MIGAYFTLFVSIFLPLAALVYFLIKRRRLVLPYVIGALTFTVFQLLTRIPLMQGVLPGMGWFRRMSENLWLYYLFAGFTAALFEEGGRYLTMHLLLKRNNAYEDAIAFGIGHGGIEAIMLVGVAVLYVLSIGQPEQVSVYAGVERISAMAMHTAWSVLVMRTLQEKRIRWLLIAFLGHFAVDFFTIILNFGISIPLFEGILFAAAIGLLLYALKMKNALLPRDPLCEGTTEEPSGQEDTSTESPQSDK